MADSSDRSLKWYSTREPAILLILAGIAVIFFLAVSLLARVYHDRQASQAEKWFRRGTYDQQKGLLDRAVGEFQAAQLYSRGNFDYQLSLAQTLTALGRTDEAYSYLLGLHEQKPESGTVNLALARIFAKKGDAATAIRYYHNALYATWPADAENQRLAGRLELIEFLLHENDDAQAQSELIAMSANLPPDAALHARTGELFFRSQDYEHSLEQYLEALKLNGHDPVALKGAGRAAFELGRYSLAQRYLQAVTERNSGDSATTDLLNTTNLVLKMDPFLRRISVSQRHQIVIDAFATAGERLKTCTPSSTVPPNSSAAGQSTLDARWKELKPRITKAGLRQDPDLVDTAMNLVFAIEQANAQCSLQTAKDHALLLISQLHESNER
jgi:tetratricopeptide (TPR) repeat protein